MTAEVEKPERSGTVRGAHVDALIGRDRYLIKGTSKLRLTYQIRLLTFAALDDKARLVIVLPKSSKISRDLRSHVRQYRDVVLVERR